MSSLTIEPSRRSQTISKHVYGHFAEHIGRCIYDGLWVGEDSEIANVRGIRSDAAAALRRIGVPLIRWPGGCFADTYHWRDGIGLRSDRPSTVNVNWGDVREDNSFGTHEFLDLCKQLECEPYICGNVGSGTVREMAEWIEYLNSESDTALTREREQNGRTRPWGVNLWGIGNENWGCGGLMSPERYADEYLRFAAFCHDYGDSRLTRIACGANEDDLRWTEVLMQKVKRVADLTGGETSDFLQGLALHYYVHCPTQVNTATGFGEAEWYGTLREALRMDDLICGHSQIMDRYDPDRKVALVVDEWGAWYDPEPETNPHFLFQQNTMRDALVAATTFDIFHTHAARVRLAAIAQVVNVLQAMILTDGPKMVLTPTYHVFEMNRVHHDATLVKTTVECGTSGSEPYEVPTISASASRKDSGPIHLSVSNLDASSPENATVKIPGKRITGISGRVLTGSRLDSCNTFEVPAAVRPDAASGFEYQHDSAVLTLPPASFSVFAISLE